MYKKEFMDLAFKEAIKAAKQDEVPIGCVVVKDDVVLAKAHNQKQNKQDAIAHAEIECIRKAEKKLGTWHLDDCEMYVTLEPCIMCTGAIINTRIKKVYYGAKDSKGGGLESNIKIKEVKNINHYPSIEFIKNKEYIELLKDFFKKKR